MNESSDNNSETTLLLDKINSTIISPQFAMDKITITYKDSIYLKRFYNPIFESTLFKVENNVFEARQIRNWNYDLLGIDSILTLSLKDTTFIYHSTFDFPVLVPQLSLADCKYIIQKNGHHNMTIKQSLLDTTFTEIFYYDNDFNIYKYVNTYKENKCIYIKNNN